MKRTATRGSAGPARSPHQPTRIGQVTRILIVDDYAPLRETVVSILQLEPDLEVVGQAGNGQDAVALCLALHPDVVIMDVSMPELDGVEATRSIRKKTPFITVIGYSHERGHRAAMLKAGARGFVCKDETSNRLIQAIRDLNT